jgi:HlyD family secretion protein
MRKLAIWGLILVVVAGAIGGALWLRRRAATQVSQQILPSGMVARGDLEISVSASGDIAVKQQTNVTGDASGNVAHVLVSPNDRVGQGQTLVELDAADLSRSVHQAELAVEQAQLALDDAQAPADPTDIEVAQAALSNAAQALEVARLGKQTARVDAEASIVQAQRNREKAFITWRDANHNARDNELTALHEAEAQEQIARLNADVTQRQAESQYQSAYAAYLQAQTNLEDLQKPPDPDTVQQKQVQVDQAQLQLQQAQRAMDAATITAPYAGVVAAVTVNEGTLYRAGETVVTLVDDSSLYVDVTIDEIDIASIGVGQTAELTLDAYPDTPLTCVVYSIAPASTDLGGLVAYRVRLKVQDVGATRVFAGMTGTAKVNTGVVKDVLLVPNWAIQLDQTTAEAYCYKLVNGTPVRTVVTLGRQNETYTEVLSGLAEGDEVVVVAQQQPRNLFPQHRPLGG